MVKTGKKVGFIGAGNMAAALIKGIIKSDLYSPDMMKASDTDPDKIIKLYEDLVHDGV